MRIGLLECDHVDEAFAGVAGDYRDMLSRLIRLHAPDAEIVAYDVSAGPGGLPGSPAECDGWITTGSRRSVYEDLPWIEGLAGFVRAARRAESPFVGICFGHQMLAHALGGRVERAPTGWGVGAHRLEVTGPEAWMGPAAESCALLFMHQDQVTAVPAGGVVLGRTDHCPVALLRVGRTMLGVQAHPEFGAAYLDALLAARRDRIGPELADAARAGLEQTTDERVMGRWLIRFLREAA